jgi:Reverse transcriptase (RNA-dependent DNA polymerase)
VGIPTVEDRLLQRAVARIVSAIYEPDFLDCSFGYRPGRNPHMALKALRDHILTGKVRHVYEADIQGYFTHLNHEWLRKMIGCHGGVCVVMSLGTPRRMKMTFIAAPPQSRSRDALQRAGSEVVCYLVPHACRGVGPRYPHQGFSTEYLLVRHHRVIFRAAFVVEDWPVRVRAAHR